jgi:hypothetical protein
MIIIMMYILRVDSLMKTVVEYVYFFLFDERPLIHFEIQKIEGKSATLKLPSWHGRYGVSRAEQHHCSYHVRSVAMDFDMHSPRALYSFPGAPGRHMLHSLVRSSRFYCVVTVRIKRPIGRPDRLIHVSFLSRLASRDFLHTTQHNNSQRRTVVNCKSEPLPGNNGVGPYVSGPTVR